MRVLIYDRYLATAGGGEQLAGGIAAVLAADGHDVAFLTHEDVDLVWLGDRLGLDLGGVGLEVVDEVVPLGEASAGADLLCNVTYRSVGRNGARHGIYVVMFPSAPTRDMRPVHRIATSRLAPVVRRRAAPTTFGDGFYAPAELIRWHQVRWTAGTARLQVTPPADADAVTVAFGRFLPTSEPRRVEVDAGAGAVLATIAPPRHRIDALRPVRVRVPIRRRRNGTPVEIVVRSETSVAHDELGNRDRRALGVPIVGVDAGGGWADRLAGAASVLVADPPNADFADTYDRLVSISGFTQRWVSAWWGRASEVLHPPVRLRSAGEKQRIILSVGRFFGAERGHSKKQLELVHAFAALREGGGAEGWELHLAGGCHPDDQDYLASVRAAAVGLPVVFHVDASGPEVDELFAAASIYWHATGLGEDPDEHPERLEHFGITTVEAMSAAAVPVVIAQAGQLELVTPGVDGELFDDVDGLVAATHRLIVEPERRAALGAAARSRAEAFGPEAFADRLRSLVGSLGS